MIGVDHSRVRLQISLFDGQQKILRRETVFVFNENAQQLIVVQNIHVTFDFLQSLPHHIH